MVSLSGFLFVYVLGGLTFIPLLILAVLLHAHYTLPRVEPSAGAQSDTSKTSRHARQESSGDHIARLDLPEELKKRPHEPDVAAGYFAVCREYVPGGVNGKPPERTTPAGEVIAPESPSVYQSMYRSIFDRNKGQSPTLDSGKATTKPLKRARNVFFVVLRHGHLMLYDDSEQLEVRHVISLAYHEVDIYGGGETIPEGELFIKRNCIRLVRRRAVGDIDAVSAKPFYLFSDDCSQKEDFYHAMLANQEKQPGAADSPPTPLKFDTKDIIKLVQNLHASEDLMQTRWFNALLGRVFLSLYKTPEVEDFIRAKITKKIARVPKPAFITSISVEKIDMGDAAPMITHPKLKELTVDGEMTGEADIHYKGNFAIEIMAVARIELGSRFKAREVHLRLSGILKKLEGHILLRIKPPPSNRLWISFETAPNMEMSIEPIVSSRQITYGVILRAIESRIREVMGETLVYPNWDDIPFHDTMLQRFRAGIWRDDTKVQPMPDPQTDAAQHGQVDKVDKVSNSDDEEPEAPAISQQLREKTMSMPSLVDSAPSGLTHRKSISSKSTLSVDGGYSTQSTHTSMSEQKTASKPRAIRSTSLASVADPVVHLDPATVEALKSPHKQGHAQSAMKDISLRSPATSPLESPVGSPPQPSIMDQFTKRSSGSSISSKASQKSQEVASAEPEHNMSSSPPKRSSTVSSASTMDTTHSHESNKSRYPTLNRAALNQAGTMAKNWFAKRQAQHAQNSQSSNSHVPTFTAKDAAAILRGEKELPQEGSSLPPPAPGTPSNPIGRGQPLPPPGTPLPRPQKPPQTTGGWYLTTKRKPVTQSSANLPATSTRRNSSSESSTPADVPSMGGAIPFSTHSTSAQGETEPFADEETAPDLPPRRGLPNELNTAHDDPQPPPLAMEATPIRPPPAAAAGSATRRGHDRRKSSTASLTNFVLPPSPRPAPPPRRKRLSTSHGTHSLESSITHPNTFSELLVVEAPTSDDASPIASPRLVSEDPLAAPPTATRQHSDPGRDSMRDLGRGDGSVRRHFGNAGLEEDQDTPDALDDRARDIEEPVLWSPMEM